MSVALATVIAAGVAQFGCAHESLSLRPSDEPWSCSLDGGAVHRFTIARDPGAGDASFLILRQDGLDVVVTIRSAPTEIRTDSPGGRYGIEVLQVSPGAVVEIEARLNSNTRGSYSVDLVVAGEDAELATAYRALSLAGIDFAKGTAESMSAAANNYSTAIGQFGAIERTDMEALAHYQVATSYRLTDRYAPALEHFKAAIPLFEQLDNQVFLGRSLNGAGLVSLNIAYRIEQALSYFERALPIADEAGDYYVAASAMNNICLAKHHLGRLQEAAQCYPGAIEYFDLHDNGSLKSFAVFNLAVVHRDLGDPLGARPMFDEALALAEGAGNPFAVASVLLNRSALEGAVGDYQRAVDDALAAREGFARIGRRGWVARADRTIGSHYRQIGAYARARDHYHLALDAFESVGMTRGLAEVSYHLGQLNPKSDAAIAYYRAGLVALRSRPQQGSDPILAARLQLALGDALLARDEFDESLALANQVLGIGRKHAIPLLAADAHLARGRIHFENAVRHDARVAVGFRAPPGRTGTTSVTSDGSAICSKIGAANLFFGACIEYAVAGEIYASQHHSGGASAANIEIAKTLLAAGATNDALAIAEDSIASLGQKRAALQLPEFRATLVAAHRRGFEVLINGTLRRAGADAEEVSLRWAENMRAQSLQEIIDLRKTADSSSKETGQIVNEMRLLSRRLDDSEPSQRHDLQTRILQLQIRLDENNQLGVAPGDGVSSRALQDNLARLTENAALLSFFMGEDRVFAWLATDGQIRTLDLGSSAALEATLVSIHEAMQQRNGRDVDYMPLLEQVSSTILAPIWSELRETSRLILVPDGALWILPFAALPAPDGSGSRLVETHTVEYLPAIAALTEKPATVIPESGRPLRILAVSDPVYAVDRGMAVEAPSVVLRSGDGQLAPLPGSRREVERLFDSFSSADIVDLTGHEARRKRVLSYRGASFDIVHIATHGVLNVRYPALSGLALSAYDANNLPIYEFLSLEEIADLGWQSKLVFLSGCDTAIGKRIYGEGQLGIGRQFLAGGARAVVSTIWKLDDEAAVAFAAEFYSALAERRTVSEAVQIAQLAMIEDSIFGSPYYWAPYVLQQVDFAQE